MPTETIILRSLSSKPVTMKQLVNKVRRSEPDIATNDVSSLVWRLIDKQKAAITTDLKVKAITPKVKALSR
jgi:hypothetical protein